MVKTLAALLTALVLVNPSLTSETQKLTVEPSIEQWEDYAFRIEDSKSRVGFALVKLSVSKLIPINGELIGHYEIDVPLMNSKNDRGKIVLPLDMSVSMLGEKGGVLKGKAISELDENKINQIVCEIIPQDDQGIRLAITTSERTLHFESRYTVIENNKQI